jgi:hypothetical protein
VRKGVWKDNWGKIKENNISETYSISEDFLFSRSVIFKIFFLSLTLQGNCIVKISQMHTVYLNMFTPPLYYLSPPASSPLFKQYLVVPLCCLHTCTCNILQASSPPGTLSYAPPSTPTDFNPLPSLPLNEYFHSVICLVILGCFNRLSQTGWLKQKMFIS